VRDLKRLEQSIVNNVLQVKDLFYLLLIERESRRFLLLRPWERHGMKMSPFQAPDFYGSPFSGGGAPHCFAPAFAWELFDISTSFALPDS
jgi:hypothetical protein